MAAGLHKSDPLADQWAKRHNASEIVTSAITKTDEQYANGEPFEFDEMLDYVDEQERRSRRPANAWSAEGSEATADANLIAAACSPSARGDRALARLQEKGYTIVGNEFDELRRKNAEFMAQDWRDVG